MVAQSHKSTIDARIQVVEVLLNAGALCEQTDKYGSMPITLLETSTQGKEVDEQTKLLLTKLQPKQPLMHQAIMDRDVPLLETLLSDDSRDVNETFQNETLLSLVIRNFLDDVASVSTETSNVHAASEFSIPMIKFLLKKGADPNCLVVENSSGAIEDVEKEPALHKLVCTLRDIYRKIQMNDQVEDRIEMLSNVIDLLITSGANIPLDTILLLHQAARLNECVFATFLLEKMHIDPNTNGRQGMTPLHFAARSGKLEMLVSTFSCYFYCIL